MSRRVEYEPNIGWVPTGEDIVEPEVLRGKHADFNVYDEWADFQFPIMGSKAAIKNFSEWAKSASKEETEEFKKEATDAYKKLEEDDMSEKIKANPSSSEDWVSHPDNRTTSYDINKLLTEIVNDAIDKAMEEAIDNIDWKKADEELNKMHPDGNKEAFDKAIDSHENAVDHPSHYSGKVEAIDSMRYLFGDRAVLDFAILNSYKYLFRRKDKNSEQQDIEKALWYIDYAKKLMDGKLGDEINAEIKSRS